MELLLNFLLFSVGLLILVKSSDLLVENAVKLAALLSVSPTAIGLTVVAVGTSLPEFVTSVVAVLRGNTELLLGNILGSNVCNIALLLGIIGMVVPILSERRVLRKDCPAMLFVTFLFVLFAVDWLISLPEGLCFLLFFALYVLRTFQIQNSTRVEVTRKEFKVTCITFFLTFLLTILVYLGAKLMIEGAVGIAAGLGVSEALIGLTMVAVGTSLPELAVSFVSAKKEQAGMALGNIVGSNIANLGLICGVSALIMPLPLNFELVISTLFAVLTSLLLTVLLFGPKLGRPQASLLLLLYACFLWVEFSL